MTDLDQVMASVVTRLGQASVTSPGASEPEERTVTIFSVPDVPEVFGYVYPRDEASTHSTEWYVDVEDGQGYLVRETFEQALRAGVARGLQRRNFLRVSQAETWPYSPSQINKYEDCPRMWGWEYLEGFRPPPKATAAWGTEAHRQAENWFRHATPPDPETAQGRAVIKALPYLPAPGAHLEVEENFRFEEDGFVFRGQVDLSFISVDGPYIIDHKTTGDFSWALSEDTLRHDTQAVIYAKAALDKWNVDELTLHWNYMLRTSSKSRTKQVKIKVAREEIEAAFDEVKETVREIESVRKSGKRALDLPIVPTSCGKYGGCAHQERCGLTAIDRMKAIMSQEGKKRMNLKEKMKARQAAKAAAAQGGAPAPAPSPVAAAPAAAAPVAAAPAAAAPAAAAPAVNPPEALAAPAAAPAPAAPAAARGTSRQGRAAAQAQAPVAAPAAAPVAPGSVSGVRPPSDREAFVGIYSEAVRAGDPRSLEMADAVWSRYKANFG